MAVVMLARAIAVLIMYAFILGVKCRDGCEIVVRIISRDGCILYHAQSRPPTTLFAGSTAYLAIGEPSGRRVQPGRISRRHVL